MAELSDAEEALVFRQHFDDVRDLVRELHPLAARWSHTLGSEWIFRGHWCSSWELVPSLYRKDKIDKFLTGMDAWEDVVKLGAEGVQAMETTLLTRVFAEFDRAGLEIPEVQSVRGLLDDTSYLPDVVVPFVALAQHHGVPTRLLDWTTQGKVAAYFAAAGVTHGTSFRHDLEVVAININAFAIANLVGKDDVFRVVHAPRASNSNLHAQSGVFTVCHGQFPKTPLDKLILERLANTQPRPVVQRLTLPQALAGALLNNLHAEGVSGSTMFPGYDGTVRRLQEEKFYFKPYSLGTAATTATP